MDEHIKKNPASESTLDRIYKNKSLRIGCIILIAHEVFYSNAELVFGSASLYSTTAPNSVQRCLERALTPESHIGRTDAAQQLTSLVKTGLLSKSAAHQLRYAACLVAREPNLKIDPLLEVARRVLARHLAEGGWHG